MNSSDDWELNASGLWLPPDRKPPKTERFNTAFVVTGFAARSKRNPDKDSRRREPAAV